MNKILLLHITPFNLPSKTSRSIGIQIWNWTNIVAKLPSSCDLIPYPTSFSACITCTLHRHFRLRPIYFFSISFSFHFNFNVSCFSIQIMHFDFISLLPFLHAFFVPMFLFFPFISCSNINMLIVEVIKNKSIRTWNGTFLVVEERFSLLIFIKWINFNI